MGEDSSKSKDMAALVAAEAREGLIAALLDADGIAIMADVLDREYGFPRRYSLILLKLIPPFLRRVGKEVAEKVLESAMGRAGKVVRLVPKGDAMLAALKRINNCWNEGYQARQQFKEVVQGKRSKVDPDVAKLLELPLQAHLAELAKQDATEKYVNPQPPLLSSLSGQSEDSDRFRLVYHSQFIPFVGREHELRTVEAFLEKDEQCSWMILEGPAGAGKSRLAWECCRRFGVQWRAGFFEGEIQFDFDKWQPDQDTLIVLDYAGNRPGLRDAIIELAIRQHELRHKVRLLLLERDRPEQQEPVSYGFSLDWVEQLLGSDSKRDILAGLRHHESLSLKDLGEDGLWQVMRAFLGEQHDARRNEYLQGLRAMDPEGRPCWPPCTPCTLTKQPPPRPPLPSRMSLTMLCGGKRRSSSAPADHSRKIRSTGPSPRMRPSWRWPAAAAGCRLKKWTHCRGQIMIWRG